VNKSKARRERKFNLQLYRKVQIEYAKTLREISRPVVMHPSVKADLIGSGDGSR
jgi:hypothetical protein